MASPRGKPGNSVGVSLQGVQPTIEAIAALPRQIAQKRLLSALNRSIKPTKTALKSNVAGLGQVTGNLQRAVTSRSVLYPSGVAVAVVGFRRAGKGRSKKGSGSVRTGADRAFHSHLIEFGTKPRRPLTMLGRNLQSTASGRRTRQAMEQSGLGGALYRDYGFLSSGSSRGFFSRADGGKNFFVTISPRGLRQVAGTPAFHPMRNAFNSTASAVQAKLESELGKALAAAVKDVAKLNAPKGE